MLLKEAMQYGLPEHPKAPGDLDLPLVSHACLSALCMRSDIKLVLMSAVTPAIVWRPDCADWGLLLCCPIAELQLIANVHALPF